MFKLVISDDEGRTTTVPLIRDEITIGRKEGNTIRLTDRNVSRRHARLQKQNGHYLLHDLGSYNGTIINGTRVTEARPLKHGDLILIGDYKLSIIEESTAQVQVPPPVDDAAVTLEALPVAPAAVAPAGSQPAPAASQPAPAPVSAPSHPPALASSAAAGDELPDHIREMRLVFLAPPGVPPGVTIERLPLLLGRSEAADVNLPFSSISREHARLVCEHGQLIIEDLGSSNGVLVNGTKVTRAALVPGDHVTLGVVEFRVARRGESTVVIDTSHLASRKRSSTGLLLGGLGAVVAVAGVVAAVVLRPSAPANTSITPTASAGSNVQVPPPVNVPTAVPVVGTPTSSSSATAAVPSSPSVPQPPSNNAPSPVAEAVPPTRAQSSGLSSSFSESRAARPTERVRTQPSTVSVSAIPQPSSRPVTQASSSPVSATSTTSTGTPRGSTASSSTAAAPSAGESPLETARACIRRGDNQCAVDALRGRAQTEPELALLAATLRQMGNRAEAVRVMQRYLNRFPNGPRAEAFRAYVEGE